MLQGQEPRVALAAVKTLLEILEQAGIHEALLQVTRTFARVRINWLNFKTYEKILD